MADSGLTGLLNRQRICAAIAWRNGHVELAGRVLMIAHKQKIGFFLVGLCVLLEGCAHDRTYSIALETDGVKKTPDCTIVLKSEVDRVIEDHHLYDRSAHPAWTIRDFQIELERVLHRRVEKIQSDCSPDDKTPLSAGSIKWLASYAYESTDPDQELRRFEEYLNSRKLAKELIQRVPVLADERVVEVEGVVVSEGACDRRSQWFGNPETPDASVCSTKPRPLYKVLTSENEQPLFDQLLSKVKEVRTDRNRNVRFFVLGYEIPWDEDRTLIRYGMRFYFVDRFDLDASTKDERAT